MSFFNLFFINSYFYFYDFFYVDFSNIYHSSNEERQSVFLYTLISDYVKIKCIMQFLIMYWSKIKVFA